MAIDRARYTLDPSRSRGSRLVALAMCAMLVASLAGAGVSAAEPFEFEPLETRSTGVWVPQDPGTAANFDGVHFVDEFIGWVSGDAGTMLKTVDGGEEWFAFDTGTDVALASVFFIDEEIGWAVGDGGTILKSTDGGEMWEPQVSGTDKNLWGVQFLDADRGWAVGIPGGYGPPPEGEYSPILRTEDGGENWVDLGNDEYNVNTIHFIDAETGWAAGNDVLIKTTDGGVTWTDMRPDFFEGQMYWTAHFVDAQTGWVVGGWLDDGGYIMHTTDGGETWELQYGGRHELIDVHFVDGNTGWVTGTSGTILFTADGGETWVAEWSGTRDRYIRNVFFVDAETGWAVGQGGLLLKYGTPDTIPVAGGGRYETAVAASQQTFPYGAETVVIATGRNWPDALGGSALAGALGGPILLVATDVVPAAVAAEVERLEATHAVIVGGEVAVGQAVVDALEDAGLTVERIAGGSRYETADAVALRVIEEMDEYSDRTAFVATGASYADAVAAAPLAAAKGWPLFLAHPTRGLSDDTTAAMESITRALVLGGELAVSAEVLDALVNQLGGSNVERLSGGSRYETAVTIATYGVSYAGLGWNRVGIATGQAYPDALAGGVLQGMAGSVMLLTRSNSLDPATEAALVAHKDAIETVTFFGGEAAVSLAVREAVAAALAGTSSTPVPTDGSLYTPSYQPAGDEVVVITTSKGVIKFEFYFEDAPNHVAAFIERTDEGFYDGIKFHRVEPNFVIQGGDPLSRTDDPMVGTGGPGYRLAAEFNERSHLDGTVAMARAMDPDSAGSQFYICLGPQPFLDGEYTVFGQVIEGLDVVHSIARGDVMESVRIERGE